MRGQAWSFSRIAGMDEQRKTADQKASKASTRGCSHLDERREKWTL